MAYGSFAVRVAPGPNKAKWKVEIHKTARAALKAARKAIDATPWNKPQPQVCVFDMSKWAAKPVCLKRAGWNAGRKSGTTPKRKHERVPYHYAPAGLKAEIRGGRLVSFTRDRHGNPGRIYF